MDDEKVLSFINIIKSLDVKFIEVIMEFFPFIKKMIPDFIKKRLSLYKITARMRKEARALVQV